MASILEEARNLMPGRGHSNWKQPERLEEAKQASLDFGGGKATGTAPKPGHKVKIKGKIWTVAKAKAQKGSFSGKTLYSITLKSPDGKATLEGTYTPSTGTIRLDKPGTLTKLGGHSYKIKQHDVKFIEAVAGAPGAFAMSDAEPPSFEDVKADLLHHVRNPSWEYPSWTLPKVGLDEGDMSKWKAAVSVFDKASDYATAAKAMKRMKAMAAGQDDSHYANAIAHRVSRLRKLKSKSEAVEGGLDEMSGASKPRTKKQVAWNQAFVTELEKLVGKTHSLDWSTINHLYHQRMSVKDAAHKIAKLSFGAKTSGPGFSFDAKHKREIKKAVKEAKGMGMDLAAATQVARFVVKRLSMVMSTPGAEEELTRLVKADF